MKRSVKANLPTYGSMSEKNIRVDKPCKCGGYTVRAETGECAACWSRANKHRFGNTKPLPMRSKLDSYIADRQLANELSGVF